MLVGKLPWSPKPRWVAAIIRVGEDAYGFVNGYWSQAAVVGRLALLLQGDAAIPADW